MTASADRAREEAGEALDAFLARMEERHRTRLKGWRLWGGTACAFIGAGGSSLTVEGFHHHAWWLTVPGVAVIAAACVLLGYWIRLATS
jgi:hypothetical protein